MTKFYFALVFSVLLIITGCSKKTSEEYIALAETKIQENDIPTAIIESKNAISANPQDPKSRFILGSLYAQRGSSAAAEKELLRASELGYEPNDVLPLLANVYSLQFKNTEIIKLVEGSRNLAPEVTTSLLLYKALAHFQLGEPFKAKKAVADANEISSDSLYSKLGNAYVDFSNKQIDTSLEKINEILKEQPDFADAHLLKGQLTSISKDSEGSVKSFEKYKELLPQTFQSRVFLANAYIKNKQFEEAEKELDVLLKVNPEQPFINQLKGAVRFHAQDFSNAKLFAEKAIQNGSDGVPNKIIAGMSAFRLGSYEQSYNYISSIKDKLLPQDPILKILAVLELKLGITNESGMTLTSLDGLTEDDVILLSATSSLLMRDGKTAQQKSILDKVDSIEFNDPLRIAQKGMLRLSLDDVEGLSDLEQALALEPDQDVANTALAKAYINNELYDKALELSDTWIQQKPDEVYGYVLAAVSYAKLKKTNQAENMFNHALSIDPNNIAANTYYADKAVEVDDKKSALTFISKILRSNPDHLSSLRQYFILQRDLGDSVDGLKPIERAFNQFPQNLQFRLLFAQALFTQSQYVQSIAVLEDVSPGDFIADRYWLLLGNAFYANGQLDKAISVTEKWVSEQANSIIARQRLIALLDIAKNSSKALSTAKLAQQIFPKEEQFGMLVTHFNIATGNIKAAELSFASLSDEIKKSFLGQGLLGQILLEKGDANAALPKLKALFNAIPNVRNRSFVAKALKESGDIKEAIDFLRQNGQLEGGEILATIQIAELAINDKNYFLAIAQYKKILIQDPHNIRALNNLASLLIEQKDYEDAIQYAKSAVDLKPTSPSIMDTYGLALMRAERTLEAMDYFKKALKIVPSSSEIQLHYVEVLVKLNEKPEAKRLLDQLKVTDSITQAEVARIRAML